MFVTGGSKARLWYSSIFDMDYAFCRKTATSLDLSVSSGKSSQGAFAIGNDDKRRLQHLVVVGGDYAQPGNVVGTAVIIDHKTGFSFPGSREYKQRAAQTPPHGYRSSVAYDARLRSWVTVGPNGTDVSIDDGLNWHALLPQAGDDPNADKQWNALSLPYVVGPHGRIGRLRDDALAATQNSR